MLAQMVVVLLILVTVSGFHPMDALVTGVDKYA